MYICVSLVSLLVDVAVVQLWYTPASLMSLFTAITSLVYCMVPTGLYLSRLANVNIPAVPES